MPSKENRWESLQQLFIRDLVTQKLKTTMHRTTFSYEHSPYRIVRSIRDLMTQKFKTIFRLTAFSSDQTQNDIFDIIQTKNKEHPNICTQKMKERTNKIKEKQTTTTALQDKDYGKMHTLFGEV